MHNTEDNILGRDTLDLWTIIWYSINGQKHLISFNVQTFPLKTIFLEKFFS